MEILTINNWGLLSLGIIQIGTAVIIFISVYNTTLFGITTLPRSFSHYRYMLTALWITVCGIFVVGTFNRAIESGAVMLAVVNAVMEIAGYWMGVRDRLYRYGMPHSRPLE